MPAGRYRNLVTIESPVRTTGANGERSITSWKKIDQVWADIQPVSAREIVRSEKTTTDATHTIKMRYTPIVSPEIRLNFQGRIFNVVSVVNPGERNVELHLVCGEAVRP